MTLPARAVVLGLARSGQAAAAALARRGVEVVGVDRKLGNDGDAAMLDRSDLVVRSPGIPASHMLLQAAYARGVPVWSEIELGARLLPNPLLCVTGTNGKTTTSELLGHILGVPVAGNVGRALCELDGVAGADASADAWIVCEVSSFQLEDVHDLRPRIAILLNLEPDHLDRHGSFDAYRSAKLRLFENQREDDAAVVPRGFGAVPGRARRIEFSAADPLPAEPRIRGAHNRENAAAATTAARAAGASDDAIAEALRSFPGVPHRLELVAECDGVRYVNDSKATNVAAALRALAAYRDEPVHLIIGGRGKGEALGPLTRAIGPNVRGVYAIGEAAEEVVAAIPAARRAGDLRTAVSLAAEAARAGDVVLLSPAATSYDQYENFEQRGEDFRRLVENLEACAGGSKATS
jgi:UDP-N-acetylmuramoylalanine--D-glutamate ligase